MARFSSGPLPPSAALPGHEPQAAGKSHYEPSRLYQNDVVASHYESSAFVAPAGGLMRLEGLMDVLY